MTRKNLPLLLFCILSSELIGSLGGFLSFSSIDSWYTQLQKSALNPPNWVFSPVWFGLFALLGLSLYLVILVNRKKVADKKNYFRTAMVFFIIQWLLNIFWSFLFFYLRSPLLAFEEIVLLMAFVIMTMYYFHRLRPVAAYILIPYFVWIMFAAYLNFMVWQLN